MIHKIQKTDSIKEGKLISMTTLKYNKLISVITSGAPQRNWKDDLVSGRKLQCLFIRKLATINKELTQISKKSPK